MGCSCNSTLLQLNTFANQLFCNTKPLQLVHFVTHAFATQRFWSLFLWCPFPQLLFAQECLFTCFFFQLFVQKLVFHLTYFFRSIYGQQFLCSFLMVVIVSSFAAIASPSSPQSLQKSRRHWHKPWTSIMCIFLFADVFFRWLPARLGCLPGRTAHLGCLARWLAWLAGLVDCLAGWLALARWLANWLDFVCSCVGGGPWHGIFFSSVTFQQISQTVQYIPQKVKAFWMHVCCIQCCLLCCRVGSFGCGLDFFPA